MIVFIVGFLMVLFFIIRVVDVKVSDAKLENKLRNKGFKQSKKNIGPRRVTINSIEKSNQKTVLQPKQIQEFEDMMEKSFYTNINKAIERIPNEFKDSPQMISLTIIGSLGSTYKSFKEKFINDTELNSVISNERIMSSLNKVRDKVKKRHLE